ncbi:MAG: SIMPL domain-containing protein, partial [Rhizobiaceae bacterium]
GDTARAALDANNAAMAEVIAALKAEGIEARDLQTSNFNINPRWYYPQNPDGSPTQEQPRIVGYDVFNGLTVRVRDLARLGAILDRSVTLGVNQGGQVSFTNDNPAAVLKEARKAAVADALDKARTLAEAAGVGVGRILEMSETNFMPQPVPMMEAKMAMARDAAPVPIEAGENVWRVNVTVTFEISQ